MTRDPAPDFYDPRHPESAQQRWPAPPATPVALTSAALPPRRRSLIGDVSAGLFLGDFADELGLPGAVTQVAISFVPLIGSMCAVRDLVADVRRRDRVGAVLNFLALTPVLGGFSKTFEVIRSTAHIGHAVHVSRHQAERRRDEQSQRRA
ncbi:MAG TPA: hypothetical protein VF792_02855 [Ktedonobacterales bacterium]